jgi:cyclopropane-fatty-acyl-phospholipid synthase
VKPHPTGPAAPAVPAAPAIPARTAVPAQTAAPAGNAPFGNRAPTAPEPVADPHRWPDVARLPRASAVRTATARLLVRRALDGLPLRVALPDGSCTGDTGPVLRLRDPEAFYRRIGAGGLIGFGESYMAAEWDAEDLVGVLTVLAAHATELVPAGLQRLRGLWAHRRPRAQANTPDGAKENIRRHYDLSNELFALFLDETMTYSSAVFAGLPARQEELPEAQAHKFDRLLDLAEVGEGTRLLEIGTGWGELALRAARRGARVWTVTLSEEQRGLARRRIAEAGLADRVTVELCDYRQVRGRFDAVVSVEMVEAVGAAYWPVYFRALAGLTAPGGRIALQAITMAHERMLATARTHTWIDKYVFPGGLIPSRPALAKAAGDHGLRIARDDGFGPHYAETLRLWRERFAAHEGDVGALGFDAVFRRMWEFYLAYSEAGFRAGYLDVRQLLLTAASGTEDA